MQNFKIKFYKIFIPTVGTIFTTIFIYNILRWGLDLKLGLLPFKDSIFKLWLPLILPWLPIFILLRRRLKILKLPGNEGHMWYQFVIAAAISIPLINSQSYIEKAIYPLIPVDQMEELINHPDEKYFQCENFEINKTNCLSFGSAEIVGSNSKNLYLKLFYVCPLSASQEIWYGIKYKTNIESKLSQTERKLEQSKFIEASEIKFQNHDFQDASYFEKTSNSNDLDAYTYAIKEKNSDLDQNAITVLVPINGLFEERTGTLLHWFWGTLLFGICLLSAMLLIPKVDPNEWLRFKNQEPIKEDDDTLKWVFSIFNPFGEYKGLFTLVFINFCIFLIMVLSGHNPSIPGALLEFGANRRAEVLDGEYWRLLTSCFVHIGFNHFFLNMIGLTLTALLIEKTVGSYQLVFIYLLTGIMASLASIYWNENTLSLGASGAIFGLYGYILALTIFDKIPDDLRFFAKLLLLFEAGYGLIAGIFMPEIDNAAHFGGLMAGFIFSILLISLKTEKLKAEEASP